MTIQTNRLEYLFQEFDLSEGEIKLANQKISESPFILQEYLQTLERLHELKIEYLFSQAELQTQLGQITQEQDHFKICRTLTQMRSHLSRLAELTYAARKLANPDYSLPGLTLRTDPFVQQLIDGRSFLNRFQIMDLLQKSLFLLHRDHARLVNLWFNQNSAHQRESLQAVMFLLGVDHERTTGDTNQLARRFAQYCQKTVEQFYHVKTEFIEVYRVYAFYSTQFLNQHTSENVGFCKVPFF